ncbi:MAG: ATP-binding cassette domain-containing protein [Peptoniphilus sp.]|uniref:sulfate/molybdate ABC transporter ATP-binding protein n=1 Tax=Peptoniphilus sp. TaxID=1971214 RepID=UPI0025DF87DF|nr:ATP-binding cassette domain-containing protein [Peptoniphilus sp.]MCI5644072.1 ATP-binding cassette domain-containing protein [Peptoniphilus sp.]MDD7353122.1 ATP-binding cassette domain-containing protein [Peptoniphilaceae bacterium]MDY3902698.1 ATP-binding cassette domain-containing protein [Peptoniphilus sp.]
MIEINIKKQIGNFNLDVNVKSQNKILGILGESGSGKTMILKCIAGLIDPDEGYIKFNTKYYDSSKSFSMKTENRKVGYMFQSYALFPNMTAEKNIYFVCQDKKKTKELLKKVGLYEKKDLFPKNLSGGQKQRLAMARMLSINPEVILLDESFSALDSVLRDEMEKFIKDLITNYDITTILVSHNKEEVYRFSEDALVIKNGHIEDFGSKEEVFFNPKNKYSAKLVGFDIFLSQDKRKDFEFKEKPGPNVAIKSKNLKIKDGSNFIIESKEDDLEGYFYNVKNKNTEKIFRIKSNLDLKIGSEINIEVISFVNIHL